MNIGFIPAPILIRLTPDENKRRHLNPLLSISLLILFAATPLLGWIAQLPHFCLFEKTLDIPCPGCGMTTALIQLMHGNLSASLQSNPCGALFVATIIGQICTRIAALTKLLADIKANDISSNLDKLIVGALLVHWFFSIVF